jgi:hypothetical protein
VVFLSFCVARCSGGVRHCAFSFFVGFFIRSYVDAGLRVCDVLFSFLPVAYPYVECALSARTAVWDWSLLSVSTTRSRVLRDPQFPHFQISSDSRHIKGSLHNERSEAYVPTTEIIHATNKTDMAQEIDHKQKQP